MRICIISPGCYPLLKESTSIRSAGGAETQFKTLGLSLSEKGYDVHFIVGDYGQASLEHLGNIKIHKVPLRYQGGSNLYLFYDWFVFLKTLQYIDASIHLLKIPKDILFPLGLFCKVKRRKLIYIGQSDKDADIELLFKLQGKRAALIYRTGLLFADFVVAQNLAQLKGFKSLGKHCQVIKNTLTSSLKEEKEKQGYILWVGNSTDNKQPHLFPELAIRFPQYQFKMIMSPSMQRPDDEQYKEYGLSLNNFNYLGFVPFSQIIDYYQEASLLVCTSLREGFPNTFLQAWQCGTPVVSLNVDPDNVIKQYQLGRHSSTLETLCHDIDELMRNHELRNIMGVNAKNYVEANHSPNAIISQYTELFKELQN